MGQAEKQWRGVDVGLGLAVAALSAEVGLPLAEPAGEELRAAVKKIRALGQRALPDEQRQQIEAVERDAGRGGCAGEGESGRIQVERTGGFAGHRRANASGHPRDAGDTHAAFPRAAFALAERAGAAALGSLGEPGAVVAREEDERVLGEAGAAEGGENFSRAPVNLLNDVAVDSAATFAFEVRGREERRVGHRVGEVDEKRFIVGRGDYAEGFLGVAFGEGGLIGGTLHNLAVALEGDVPTVGRWMSAKAVLGGDAGAGIHIV